jgi:putative membrane protein
LGRGLGNDFVAILSGDLAAIIALAVRWTGLGGQASSRTTSTARDILDERFARGEIDDDEYEKRRRILES